MKKSTFTSLLVAGIFAVMPSFLAAKPADVTLDLANDSSPEVQKLLPIIKSLQASISYPKSAVQNNIQGKFTMLVKVDESGNATDVTFEVTDVAAADQLSSLMQTVTTKLYSVNFGKECAGQTVRIPFNFRLF